MEIEVKEAELGAQSKSSYAIVPLSKGYGWLVAFKVLAFVFCLLDFLFFG